ncbi:hypothetical protein ACWGLG_16370 [Streptomyces antimycoticus]
MITPPLGRVLTSASQGCGFSPDDTDATTCFEPATWHICWGANMDASLACATHMDVAQTFAYLDRHEVGPDCDMPGAAWDFDGKRCIVVGIEQAATEHAEQPLPIISGGAS